MEWPQVWTIIGVLGSLFTIFSGFVFWGYNRLDGDVKSLVKDLKDTNSEMKTWMRHSTSRTDQLYQMFIDLLKEKK